MDYSLCMNKATLVVFLLLFTFRAQASELGTAIANLENAWVAAYYQANESQQKQIYPSLLEKAVELSQRYPNAAEVKVWQATIMVTNANFESTLTVLSTLEKAKKLLEQAIQQDPNVLDGAAYLTLGTLYYMVPGWPVSFGDHQLAEEMLKASLKINPNGIDANYFYADFLLRQDRGREAEAYFLKASQAPVRKQQMVADTQLQNEAKMALINTQQRKSSTEKNKFQSLFTSASYSGE